METNKFVFIDTETTGLDPQRHGIIQFAGMILFEENGFYVNKESFDFRLKTFSVDEVDDKALEVNGTSREEIATFRHPQDIYVEFSKILCKYCNKFDKEDKMFFVGYNARFAYDFMRRWFEKCGDNYFGSFFFYPPIDVMNLAIVKLMPIRKSLPNFKLQTVTEHFNIVPEGNLHDAFTDIDITRQLFFKLMEE